MRVVGVDGWQGGWVGVALADRGFEAAWVADTASGVLDRAGMAQVIGIDIPIGLPATGARECDRQARRLLGRRGSTVFPALPRAVLELEPYAAANARCRQLFGFGLSRQSYALRAKILQIDAIEDPRLFETHPELAFLEMSGTPLPPKRTWAGVMARRRALAAAGIRLPEDLKEAGGVPVDDVLDAAVVAWTARRIGLGEAIAVPAVAEYDELGKPMAIWR